MNTPSNAMPESFGSQGIAPPVIRATRPMYWSVQRELWENRSIYVAPLAVAAVALFGFLISATVMAHKMHGLSAPGPAHEHRAVALPYDFAAGMLMLTQILVAVFYCLDALHGERRDRSILFWKSLPVSDLTTVLSKASIPLVVLPLVTFAITIAVQWIMLLLNTAVVLGSGQSVATLWTQVSFVQMSLLLLYHLFTAHALWPAPVYCWLILVSGWARRAAFLWAVLPLVAIAGLERILFHTSHFAIMVGHRFIGHTPDMAVMPPGTFPTDPMTHITPDKFLTSPGLWIGLLVAAVFLAAAVRLRRYREPI
jgi:ABC-2 type transport system permease protein